jgi:cell division protein FtsL
VTRARAAAQIQVNQRLVRERDRQRSRELWRFLALAAVLAVPVLGYVWQRMDFLRVSRRYEKLQQDLQALGAQHEQLKVERATLMDHDRIERLARRNLGLVDPAPDDVRNVRLFDGRVGAVERSMAATMLPVPISIGSLAEARPDTARSNAGGAKPAGAARPAAATKPAAGRPAAGKKTRG